MFIITPVFAQENTPKKKNFFVSIKDSFSYQNQLKFEEEYKEKTLENIKKISSASELLSFFVPGKYMLIEELQYYNEGKKCVLAYLYNKKEDLKNSKNADSNELNLYIIDALISKTTEIAIENGYNVYANKIKLTNNELDFLDETLKELVMRFNLFVFDDVFKETQFNNIDAYVNEILKTYSSNFEDNKNNLAKLSELDASINAECQKLRALSENINKFNKHSVNYADKVARKAMDVNNQLVKLSSSINIYSRNIEKGQYLSWLKKNNLKEISNIPLYSFVYGTNYSEPNKNLLYAHQPIYPIQVLQSVSGGVLLTGSHAIPQADNIQIIFMETNKKYADGQCA